MGHEFSGIVEEAGAGVEGFRIGTRITGDPNIACGECDDCLGGRPNLCHELSAIGVHRDGGFAEYVLVPQSQAVVLPPSLSPLHGAFCEPVSCCLHAIDVARIPPGGSVVILGGGVIGLLMVELALQAGAGTVVLSTRQAPRRALAVGAGRASRRRCRRRSGNRCRSDPAARRRCGAGMRRGRRRPSAQSIQMARRGGTVVFFGVVPQGEEVAVSPFELLTKELRLESAWLNPLTHPRAAQLIADGALSLDRLITRTISLDEVPAVIAGAPVFGEIKLIMAG